jgi:hypothetical protein
MPSQIDLLKDKIPRLEAQHGTDDPYVKALKQQLSSLERRAAQTAGAQPYRENPVSFSADK